MSTHATTSSQSTLTTTESGLPALRLAVSSDATETPVVVETTLPSDVDPERVAVRADSGDVTVYADGTVQWTTSASAEATTTAEVGIPVTDAAVVDELDDVEPAVVAPDDAAEPSRDGGSVESVDVDDLSTAAPPERIPEAVYERIHATATDDGAGDGSTDESAASAAASATDAGTDGSEDDPADLGLDDAAETDGDAVDGSDSTDERTAPRAAAAVERTHGERPEPDGDSTPDGDDLVAAVETEERPRGPIEDALRASEDRAGVDETAFRFRLSFEAEDARTCAIEVLRGLLNGTTVYGANPTLPDLESGETPDVLTVTATSALDEDALLDAIERLDAVELDSFERVDIGGVPSETIESNDEDRFERLDETVEPSKFDEFAAGLDELRPGDTGFGDGSMSFDDLFEDQTPEGERAAEQQSRSSADGPEASGDATERVAQRLLEELQTGGLTERERVELRRRLGVDPQTSTEARLDHLQARFEKIAAYTDALEEFLDENGTAREILDGVVDRADALEDRTDAVEARTDELDDRTSTVDDRSDALEDRTDELEAAVEDAADARADVEARVDILESDVETERERIGSLESDLDRERQRVDDVESDLEDGRHRLEELSSAVHSNRDDLDDLADEVRSEVRELTNAIEDLDDAVTSIDDRLERLERDVEQNSEVREKLKDLST